MPLMPENAKMLSNEWFSSITTNTCVIGHCETGAILVMPPVHPPESRLTLNSVVLTARVSVLPASAL